MRRTTVVLASLAGLALLLGWASPGIRPRLIDLGTDEPRQIILISIDSLRADRLGVYGYERATSPNIDSLAEESIVFDSAYSTTSWTLPSHISMLTGLYPEVHRIQGGKQRLSEKAVLCSEVLGQSGYRTAAVVSGPYLHRRFGLNQGFDEYDDRTISFRGFRASHKGVTTPRLHARILEVLDELGDDRFFLFLHYWDVHLDYAPPEPWNTMFDPDFVGSMTGENFMRNEAIHAGMDPRDLRHLESLYDGEIAFTDHYLGLLLDELRRRGLYESSIIVITADHGDEFFEHGGKGHRRTLFNESLQVPLLLRLPGGRWAGRRIGSAVSIVDLAPTLFDLLEIEAGKGLNGRSLLPLIRSDTDRPTRLVFADLNGTLKSVIDGRWKYLFDVEGKADPELYDLLEDPSESRNLARLEPEQSDRLRGRLTAWLEAAGRQAVSLERERFEYDEETRRILESLGYVD